MKVLALNAGSNSLKFQVVDSVSESDRFGTAVVTGGYDDIGTGESIFTLYGGKAVQKQQRMEVQDYGHAAKLLFDWLPESGAGQIERIGHRVVHGAHIFEGPVRVTDEVVEAIEDLADLAPLHNKPALAVIAEARKRAGAGIENVAVFDTVFHRTIPEKAACYGLAPEIADKHKIRRYGFHGISHQYMSIRYGQITGKALKGTKLVTMHLEGGSSAAAIRDGQSIDTSMGFTPLEGLVMGTLCGDLDPAIVLYLMRKEELDSSGVEELLNKKSGLKALSGISADTRVLVKHLDNPRVRLTIDIFCYRVTKYVGAYVAALGGADALIFGGGIGENAPLFREKICGALEWLGIELDQARNEGTINREGVISKPGSRVEVWVIPTEENLMVAREACQV